MKRIVALIIKSVIGVSLVTIIVFTVFPLVPPFRGYYHTRTVLTGSMEPSILKGSIIVNKFAGQQDLSVGDVITFKTTIGTTQTFVTHRVSGVEKKDPLYLFETKGDANPVPDATKISSAVVEGKVILVIPYLGYLITFFKTPLGFGLLVVLPLVIYLIKQIFDLGKLIRQPQKPPKVTSLLILVGLLVFPFSSTSIGTTLAFFTTNTTTVTGIKVQTAADFTKPHGKICKIWENDDWIEFRNDSDHDDFDVGSWHNESFDSRDEHHRNVTHVSPGKNFYLSRDSKGDKNDNWNKEFNDLKKCRPCEDNKEK